MRPGDRVLVALSGGLDSMVLLDLLHRSTARNRIRLAALHVNHQVSPNAGRWEAFCRRACRERSIPFRSVRVDIPRGSGFEAGARAARYTALLSRPVEFIALAHHQDDQAETVLLQLLRGAGVRGLAAMPAMRRQGPVLLRPLLDTPRAEIERYAQRRRLEWIEDESNRNTRFARNFLRYEFLPAIGQRFPSYRATLARSARHLGEASHLLDQLAEIDAQRALRDGTLVVGALRGLQPARARNLLRWFLARCGADMPNSERLDESLRQIAAARSDARIRVELGAHELYCWKGGVHLVPRHPAAAPVMREWRRQRSVKLPELGGVLVLARERGAGISLARLTTGSVTLRSRVGGERLQPDCRRPRRTVKNLLQEREIPPWQRARLPLLYCGAALVWAAGLGTDCAWQAQPNEPSLNPHWRADDGMDPVQMKRLYFKALP